MSELPHNGAKQPLYIVLAGVIAIAVIVLALSERWVMAAIGAVILILLALALRAMSQGRNPWWTRAPLDRR